MFFLEKRSKDKKLLINKSFLIARKITEKFYKIYSSSIFYSHLSKKLPKHLLISYYKKKFLYENIKIFNQIVINEHDKFKNKNIFYDNFEQIKIIDSIDKNLTNKFKNKKIILKKTIISLIINLKTSYNKFFNKFLKKKKITNYQSPKIAISLVEGLDPKNRSDVFWDPEFKNAKDLLIYIDSPYILKKLKSNLPLIKRLKEKGVNIINVWEEDTASNTFKDIFNKLEKIKPNSFLDYYFKNITTQLLLKVNFWINFFIKYNIKIHIDSDDIKIENIPKQIALELVNGCSLGKVKSYITPSSPVYFEYYHNNIFFCWGNRLINNLKILKKKKMLSNINNLIITGNLNQNSNKKIKKKFFEINKIFKKNGIKKILLILDTSHSDNKNYEEQLFPREKLNLFYQNIINLAVNNKKIGLIIKPKKNIDFLNKDIKKKINYLINKKQIYLENNLKEPIKNLSKISDFAISVSVDSLPTSLLEALGENKKIRAIFYDFANCSKEEKIFSWGNKKVSFDDLNEMVIAIEKNLFKPKSKIGVWPTKFVNSINPYKSVVNNNKAKFYIQSLLRQFKNNKFIKKEHKILFVNNLYKKKYGNNTVIKI